MNANTVLMSAETAFETMITGTAKINQVEPKAWQVGAAVINYVQDDVTYWVAPPDKITVTSDEVDSEKDFESIFQVKMPRRIIASNKVEIKISELPKRRLSVSNYALEIEDDD